MQSILSLCPVVSTQDFVHHATSIVEMGRNHPANQAWIGSTDGCHTAPLANFPLPTKLVPPLNQIVLIL
jgi:hypothetical protein